ncbi:MAG: hypothetical protein ACK4OF_05295 [Aquificaceae bacterium]
MTDLSFSLLRVLIALAIVVIIILITLPYILPFIQRLKWIRSDKGSQIKLKGIIPIGRNAFLVELEIKGKLFIIAMGENFAKVIYKDEAGNP